MNSDLVLDRDLLCRILGIEFRGSGRNYACPMHGDATGNSLTVFERGGKWFWRCRGACGATGTVIQAVMLLDRVGYHDAIRRLSDGYEPPKTLPQSRRQVQIPVVIQDEIDDYIVMANKYLLDNYSRIPFIDKRNISAKVAEEHMLGFLPRHRFKKHKHVTENFWSIPIRGPQASFIAVKLHKEAPKFGSKSGWAPFGIEPEDEPRHAYFNFVPEPEEWTQLKPSQDLFLCAGELKAFAMISLGFAAVAYSGGESFEWSDAMAKRFSGRNVVVIYDADIDKILPDGSIGNAGRAFRDRSVKALFPHARRLSAITLGRAEDYVAAIQELRTQ